MKGKQVARTQAERTAATRAALIAAARPLFAAHGYAGVGTEAIVQRRRRHARRDVPPVRRQEGSVRGGVRGGRGGARPRGSMRWCRSRGARDPIELMHIGAAAWLDACADPEVHRIVLIDAPAVLGWERWREIGLRYGLGLVQQPARVRDQRGPIAAAAGRAARARPHRRDGRGGALPRPQPRIRCARVRGGCGARPVARGARRLNRQIPGKACVSGEVGLELCVNLSFRVDICPERFVPCSEFAQDVLLLPAPSGSSVAGLLVRRRGRRRPPRLDNGLALTPPMGFNDWNAFGCNVDEQLIKQTADLFVSSGLKAAGYEYVNIDDCWLEEAAQRERASRPRSGEVPGRNQGHGELRPQQGAQARHLRGRRDRDVRRLSRQPRARADRRERLREVGRRLPQVRQLQQPERRFAAPTTRRGTERCATPSRRPDARSCSACASGA